MGIRVHKNIGYFLHKKNIKHILVPDYDEILDDFDNDQIFLEKMQKEFYLYTAQHPSLSLTYAKFQLQHLEKNKHSIIEFINTIYHYDDFKGIMFQTPDLRKSSHYDDLIDYYENVDKPNFRIRLLKQSIYPDNYYICLKVPPLNKDSLEVYAEENVKKPVLEVGDLVSSDKLHYLMLYEGYQHNHDRINAWAYPELNGEKYFHPYVNLLSYLAAKITGVLKPDISFIEFSQYLEPAIVTYWG